MFSCYQATRTKLSFLMDPHISTARTIRITFISSIQRPFLFLRTWKAFQSFFLCPRNTSAQAFEMLLPASMCVTCFQRASPGRPCRLAEVAADTGRAFLGWFRLSLTLWPHIPGVSRNLTAQKPRALLLPCRREGHSLLLKFWPLCLARLGAKTAASAESHIQPSSSWISEGNAKL